MPIEKSFEKDLPLRNFIENDSDTPPKFENEKWVIVRFHG